jgi:hypothetical protein
MGCNTTYIFQLLDGTEIAEFTFMFGYGNMGQICRFLGKEYIVKDVKTIGKEDDDHEVIITIEPWIKPE